MPYRIARAITSRLAQVLPIVFYISSTVVSSYAAPGASRNVAIFVHDGVELLDFAGPAEVFANASGGDRAFNVYTVAPTTQPVQTQQSVTVVPEYSIDNCPRPAILVIPGGATNRVLEDTRVMEWIKRTVPQTELTMTVCTGAFALAKNGLLDGREATTHHGALDNLQREYPNVRVRTDLRVVDNGSIVTTAGISAGIDGALHVVNRLRGEESAWTVARTMEYRWEPPALPADATQAQRLLREGLKHWIFGEWKQSADVYSRVLELEPNDVTAHSRLAVSKLRMEQYDQAISHARRALELGAEVPWMTGVLARSQLGAGDFAGAVESYNKAIAIGADSPTNHYNLACCFARLGRKDDALKSLETALTRGPYLRRQAQRDEDFASLRDDQRFTSLVGVR
jgi:putative intracellular protease/amidase